MGGVHGGKKGVQEKGDGGVGGDHSYPNPLDFIDFPK